MDYRRLGKTRLRGGRGPRLGATRPRGGPAGFVGGDDDGLDRAAVTEFSSDFDHGLAKSFVAGVLWRSGDEFRQAAFPFALHKGVKGVLAFSGMPHFRPSKGDVKSVLGRTYIKWRIRESNPRPLECHVGILPRQMPRKPVFFAVFGRTTL